MIPLWKQTFSAGTGNPDDDFQPYMTPYLLPGDDARGVVLVFPGGGYSCRCDHEAAPIAKAFNAEGFHAFVVEYRVKPYRYPAPQQDVYRAIRMIRANADKWHIAPDNIALCGFSAGGHLVTFSGVGYERPECLPDAGDVCDNVSARPDAVIGCYPVTHLGSGNGHPGSGQNLLGNDYEAQHQQYDPCALATENTPPYFLFHTATDQVVPVACSIDMAKALWSKGVTAELHVFPRGPHGVALGQDFPETRIWPHLAAVFLRGIGFKSADK